MPHTDNQTLFLRLTLAAWIAQEFGIEPDMAEIDAFLAKLQDEEALNNFDDRDSRPGFWIMENKLFQYHHHHKPGFYIYNVDGENWHRDYNRIDDLNRIVWPNPVMTGSVGSDCGRWGCWGRY